MNNEYRSDYEVRLATLAALGGDTTKDYRSVYEVDLAILAATGEAVKGLKPVVVDELPEIGEAGKIYFVPSQSGERDNYKEYVWVNNAWECIGNADVDLSSYATKTYVDSSLALKADKTEIPSLTGYATETWVEGKGYLTEHLSLADYAKTADVDSSLALKADKTEIPSLTGYAKVLTLTQAEYDALEIKATDTIYIISDAE